jgi:GT2 family glycosyltransferase
MYLSIVLVNYRSEKWLSNCLLGLNEFSSSSITFEVIIVNNDPSKFIPPSKLLFKLKILESKKNIGFGGANNLGVKNSKGKNILFLNPDTIFPKKSIESLFGFFEKNPHIGILGPKIIQASRLQPQPFTCGKKTSLLGIVFRNTILKPWNNQKTTVVDWVSGTALLIRKSLFQKVSGFDEKFFMYFEDQDLCLRIKKIGYDVCFFPKSSVLHYDGKCWPDSKQQKIAFYIAQDYFFKKHHLAYKGLILKILKKIAL